MKVPVWLAAKPGVERKHVSTTGFTPEFRASLNAQGYLVIYAEIDMPPAFDQHDYEARARVERTSSPNATTVDRDE